MLTMALVQGDYYTDDNKLHACNATLKILVVDFDDGCMIII